MNRAGLVAALIVAVVAAGCALGLGREFPSPDPAQIKLNVTDKPALLQTFGEPYQVGVDSGDQTWRWFYAQRSTLGAGSGTPTKDFTVRFNTNGTVKSYSFSSNFPDDIRKLR